MNNMDKNTKKWIIVLALVCVVGLGAWFALNYFGGGSVAVISVDGEELKRIDLSRVRESYDIEINTQYGHNTVHVAPGAIAVTEADCPDHICVNQGAITKSGVPIICMPHRLVVQIEGGGIDA